MGQTAVEQAERGESEEYINKEVWVPHGEDVVPPHLLKSKKVVAIGKGFLSSKIEHIDRLLESRLIDAGQHHVGLQVAHLYRMAMNKQDYSKPTIFCGPKGVNHSDYCPLTAFVKATKTLKASQQKCIRAICGVEDVRYEWLALNIILLKEALETIADKFQEQSHTDSTNNATGNI